MSKIEIEFDPMWLPPAGYRMKRLGNAETGELYVGPKQHVKKWDYKQPSELAYVIVEKIPPKTRVEPFTKADAIKHHGRMVESLYYVGMMNCGDVVGVVGCSDGCILLGSDWVPYSEACVKFIFHDDRQPVGRVIVEDH